VCVQLDHLIARARPSVKDASVPIRPVGTRRDPADSDSAGLAHAGWTALAGWVTETLVLNVIPRGPDFGRVRPRPRHMV
jgi:hypothetical protein